jgi:putative nucleotidyltransferase with HDIG domain
MPERQPNTPATELHGVNKAKLFLNLILILFVLAACYLEDIFLFYRPPQVGQTALLTFRSQTPFTFDEGKVYGGLRTTAMAQHIPSFVFDQKPEDAARRRLNAFQDEVLKDRALGPRGRAPLVSYLRKEFDVKISWEDATRLLRYPNLKNLLAGIQTIQESLAKTKIVKDPEPLKGKMTVRVIFPGPVGASTVAVGEIATLDQARLDLRDRVHQLFWQVDPRLLDPMLQVFVKNLQPNLHYDQKENDRKIEAIAQQFPSALLTYRPGEVLVPFLKVMDESDVLLLKASQAADRKTLYGQAALTFFIAAFSVVLYNVLLTWIFPPCWQQEPPYPLFISVLLLTILLCKASLLITPWPVYIVPFAILPLLLVLLHREKISITFVTVLGAILISLFCGRNLGIFLFLSFGGLLAILTSFKIRWRSQVFIPGFMVGIANAAVVLLLFAVAHPEPVTWLANFQPLLVHMGVGLAGGLMAGPLTLILLPLLELSRRNTSTFKLNKFSDLQHPLLVELLTKAPGTYQHSMSAGHLAHALGEALGANSLLLRVAAYYHDIGKTETPDFYVENLFGRKNPHDALPARESARIIMEHVKNGKKIALAAGLPEVVADFIPQHHGTRLIEFFYDKAVKEHPEATINQKNFRYAGPKPQTVEAAILMIVDAVEATSRTIEEPTPEKIEAMIRHIIVNRIIDGQFDECNLSTNEIAKIVTVLVHTLEASLHKRVAYPWQQKEDNGTRKASPPETPEAIVPG